MRESISKLDKLRREDGISSLEMLAVSIVLIIFLLIIFVVAAAYWNNTVLQSTSQNASLTAQFTADNAANKGVDINSCDKPDIAGNGQYDTTSSVLSTCGGVINPWNSAQQVVKHSTEDLILVPKARTTPDCLSYYSANPGAASDDSSKIVTFTLDPKMNTIPRTTTASVTTPFRPVPIPSFSGQSLFGVEPGHQCGGLINISASSTTRYFQP